MLESKPSRSACLALLMAHLKRERYSRRARDRPPILFSYSSPFPINGILFDTPALFIH